jgi:hypothetical protein
LPPAAGAATLAGGSPTVQIVAGVGAAAACSAGAVLASWRRQEAGARREQVHRFVRKWLASLHEAITKGLDKEPTRTAALTDHLRVSLLTDVERSGSEELYGELLELNDLLARRSYDAAADLELEAPVLRAESLVAPGHATPEEAMSTPGAASGPAEPRMI